VGGGGRTEERSFWAGNTDRIDNADTVTKRVKKRSTHTSGSNPPERGVMDSIPPERVIFCSCSRTEKPNREKRNFCFSRASGGIFSSHSFPAACTLSKRVPITVRRAKHPRSLSYVCRTLVIKASASSEFFLLLVFKFLLWFVAPGMKAKPLCAAE